MDLGFQVAAAVPPTAASMAIEMPPASSATGIRRKTSNPSARPPAGHRDEAAYRHGDDTVPQVAGGLVGQSLQPARVRQQPLYRLLVELLDIDVQLQRPPVARNLQRAERRDADHGLPGQRGLDRHLGADRADLHAGAAAQEQAEPAAGQGHDHDRGQPPGRCQPPVRR